MSRPLPGQEAQLKMAPAGRRQIPEGGLDESKVRKAAVMALFYERQKKTQLVLTLRSEYEGVHSGQISFPGGRVEESDRNLQETALRETEEEIGINSGDIQVVGELSSLYIPPSNFLVQPFIGITDINPDFKAEEKEVQKIISVDLQTLAKDSIVKETKMRVGNFTITVPAFHIDKHIVWGATAMMISEIREMLR